MGNLSNISGREAVKVFIKMGYEFKRQTGSHIILAHPSKYSLSVPNHKELAPGLLRSLIRHSGATIEEFLKLLS